MQISGVLVSTGKIGKGDRRMRDRLHEEAMAEVYRNDPAYALQLLNSILEDGGQSELLIALRQMAKAFGGVQIVPEKAHLNSTKRFRHLTQCNQQFALITILKNAVQQLKSVGRVVSIYLCHCFLVQSISHSPISFSNLSSTHKHARYLHLVFAYLHRITVKLFFYLQSRNKLDILRLY